MTDPTCKVCQGSWPKEDHFIADLGLSKAYLHDDQFFPGWTVVVFKRHATELFHLAPTERIQLMEEVNLVAKTLAQVYEARKINYELLGNQLPHIHWHVIPRLANDPAHLSQCGRYSMNPCSVQGLISRARSCACSRPFRKPAESRIAAPLNDFHPAHRHRFGAIMQSIFDNRSGGSQVSDASSIGTRDPHLHVLHRSVPRPFIVRASA